MIAVGSIDQLIDAFSASAWVFYGLAIGALLIMRITHEDIRRSFEVRYRKCAKGLIFSNYSLQFSPRK